MKRKMLSNFISYVLLGMIIFSQAFCSGENDEKGPSERRPPSSDSSSRAISPQKEYTKDNPAEWESIANDHLPEIVFNESKSKGNVTVKVLGRKFSERHYIEVIGLMDERLADIDIKYLKRGDIPAAVLTLNKKEYDPEKIKVFAKCNLHDLWTVPLISKE
jgi:desulfoferrodoxin (superoxide reductase-like protein)